MVGVEISQVIVGVVSSQVHLEACRGIVAVGSETVKLQMKMSGM